MAIYHFSSNIASDCKNTICAVLFHHILYWVEKNKAEGRMCYDNKYWVYQSYKQFNKRFPYLSIRQIEFSLKKLEERQLIIATDKYSNSTQAGLFKTTTWYTISERGYEVLSDDIKYATDQIKGNRIRSKYPNCSATFW